MPEIVEVNKYADFIRDKIKNKEILEINILKGRYKKHQPFDNYKILKTKLPLKVKDIKTKGKFIYFVFEDDLYLFNTLGLSGGWCYLKNGSKSYQFSDIIDDYGQYMTKESIDNYIKNDLNHLNVEFKMKTGILYFYDILSFGTLKVVIGEEELNRKLRKLGPDIMDKDTNLVLFTNQINKKNNLDKPIGIVIMNQKNISGIGNYLRSEILYLSKVSPFRKVSKITENEMKKIYYNSKLLTIGEYDRKLAKKLNFIGKLPSDYDRLFFIYNEDEDLHGNKVIKKELYEGSQKRFVYYVPKVQS
jgi:formamidopyrimidine-DNA glycosylase